VDGAAQPGAGAAGQGWQGTGPVRAQRPLLSRRADQWAEVGPAVQGQAALPPTKVAPDPSAGRGLPGHRGWRAVPPSVRYGGGECSSRSAASAAGSATSAHSAWRRPSQKVPPEQRCELGRGSSPPGLELFLNEANGWRPLVLSPANEWLIESSLAAGDVNGDGRPDLLTGSWTVGSLNCSRSTARPKRLCSYRSRGGVDL